MPSGGSKVEGCVAATDRVRLLIVTDWDAGFALGPRPPLLDAAPGDSYVTEIVTASTVTICEVLVEGFALVQISVGENTAQATIETIETRRLYRLQPPLVVSLGETIRVQLCNDTSAPLKQKDVAIVRHDPTMRPERINIKPGPAEDRVIMIEGVENRCGICGQIFQLSPDDPHTALINRTIKNAGQGPICPTERRGEDGP